MNLIAWLVVAFAAATAQTRPGTDSASSPNFSRLDSLYSARDTAGLVAAARPLTSNSSRAARLYRGISAGWSGKPRDAITLLRPLADSAVIPPEKRRDVIRILAESYARSRKYAEASEMYKRELAQTDSVATTLRSSIDSLEKTRSAEAA